jgi:hypothetical protein
MPIAYVEPLRRAWRRMKTILFGPFSLPKWVFIGFSAWVAGLLDGAGGGGGGGPKGEWKGPSPHGADPRAVGEGLRDGLQEIGRGIHHLWEQWPGAALLLLLIPLALVLLLALVWLTSRFKFIYLDNVVRNSDAIAEPWHRLGRLGDSLFFWRVGFGLVAMLVAGLLTLLFGGLAIATSGGRWTASVIVLGFGAIFLVAFIIIAAYTALFLKAFVVPIMYRLGIPAMAAWREFLPMLQAQTLPFVLYGLFVLGLFLAVGIGIVAFSMATCCIGWLLLAFPYVGTVLLLPLHVTYRLLGPEFLAQFDPRFDLFAVR